MADGNEYKGKIKLGIIAALCIVFSLWLAAASKIMLTAIVMIILSIFLYTGFRAAKYIFIVLQFTRGYYAIERVAMLFLSTAGFSFDQILYYILYLIYAVISVVMLLADKDIREFYRK